MISPVSSDYRQGVQNARKQFTYWDKTCCRRSLVSLSVERWRCWQPNRRRLGRRRSSSRQVRRRSSSRECRECSSIAGRWTSTRQSRSWVSDSQRSASRHWRASCADLPSNYTQQSAHIASAVYNSDSGLPLFLIARVCLQDYVKW